MNYIREYGSLIVKQFRNKFRKSMPSTARGQQSSTYEKLHFKQSRQFLRTVHIVQRKFFFETVTAFSHIHTWKCLKDPELDQP